MDISAYIRSRRNTTARQIVSWVSAIAMIAWLVAPGVLHMNFANAADNPCSGGAAVRDSSATISPTTATSGVAQEYTVTVNNEVTSTRCMKSAKLVVPISFEVDPDSLALGSVLNETDWGIQLVDVGGSYEIQASQEPGSGLSVEPGQSFTITFTATPSESGTITWNAHQYSNNSFSPAGGAEFTSSIGDPDVDVDDPTDETDLTIEKTVNNETPYTGNEITYTITVTNIGSVDATGVEVTDELPDGLQFESSDASQGSYDESTGIWTVGDIDSGENATLDIVATVTAEEGESVNNIAVITEGDQTPDDDDDTDNKNITVDPIPDSGSDLAVTKEMTTNGQIKEGDTVNYEITVVNNGPDAASGVVVEDSLPAEVTFVSATPSVGDYDEDTGEWNIGDMANGAEETLTIEATVNEDTAGTTITNTAVITSGDDVTGDDDDSDNDGGFDVQDTGGPQEQTGTVTVNIDVINDDGGSHNAGDFMGFLNDLGVVTGDPYEVNIGNHMVSGSEDENYELTIGGDCDESGLVAVGHNENLECTLTYDDIPTDTTADIEIVKTSSHESANNGVVITYTLTVTNHGPGDATGVVVTDVLPDGVEFVSASLDTYDEETGQWIIGDLEDQGVASLDIEANVITFLQEDIVNSASVSADQEDPDEDDNDSNVSFLANPPANNPDDNNNTGGSGGGGGGGSIILNNFTPNNPGGNGQVLGASTGPGSVLGASTCAPHFNHFALNVRGFDHDPYTILELQKFLNEYMDAGLMLTAEYDNATIEAVKAFQVQENILVLNPWGISIPTGHTYISTLTAANNIYCQLRGFDLGMQLPDLVPFRKTAMPRYLSTMGGGVVAGASTASIREEDPVSNQPAVTTDTTNTDVSTGADISSQAVTTDEVNRTGSNTDSNYSLSTNTVQ